MSFKFEVPDNEGQKPSDLFDPHECVAILSLEQDSRAHFLVVPFELRVRLSPSWEVHSLVSAILWCPGCAVIPG